MSVCMYFQNPKCIDYEVQKVYCHEKKFHVKSKLRFFRWLFNIIILLIMIILGYRLYQNSGRTIISVDNKNVPDQKFDFSGSLMPLHYYMMIVDKDNKMDSILSSYPGLEKQGNSTTKWSQSAYAEVLCDQFQGAFVNFNKTSTKIWKMKCTAQKWGPDKYGIHLYYLSTGRPLYSTDSIGNLRSTMNTTEISFNTTGYNKLLFDINPKMNNFEVSKSLLIFDNDSKNYEDTDPDIFKLRNPAKETDLIKLSLSNKFQILFWGQPYLIGQETNALQLQFSSKTDIKFQAVSNEVYTQVWPGFRWMITSAQWVDAYLFDNWNQVDKTKIIVERNRLQPKVGGIQTFEIKYDYDRAIFTHDFVGLRDFFYRFGSLYTVVAIFIGIMAPLFIYEFFVVFTQITMRRYKYELKQLKIEETRPVLQAIYDTINQRDSPSIGPAVQKHKIGIQEVLESPYENLDYEEAKSLAKRIKLQIQIGMKLLTNEEQKPIAKLNEHMGIITPVKLAQRRVSIGLSGIKHKVVAMVQIFELFTLSDDQEHGYLEMKSHMEMQRAQIEALMKTIKKLKANLGKAKLKSPRRVEGDSSLTDFSVEQTERNLPAESDEDKKNVYVSQILSQDKSVSQVKVRQPGVQNTKEDPFDIPEPESNQDLSLSRKESDNTQEYGNRQGLSNPPDHLTTSKVINTHMSVSSLERSHAYYAPKSNFTKMINTAKKRLQNNEENVIQKGHIEIVDMPADDGVEAGVVDGSSAEDEDYNLQSKR